MSEADQLRRQRGLEQRLRAMGIEAGLLPGGRAVVATLPLGPAPFETLEGPRRLPAVRFYTVGHDRIKCMAPRALFQLPPVRIVDCNTAPALEERIRSAWAARMRTLRDARRWLASLDLEAAVGPGAPGWCVSLGLDDDRAQALVTEPGRVVMPSCGPLSGHPLAGPDERVFEPIAHGGADLRIAVTVRLETLARRRRRDTVARRASAPECDLPAPLDEERVPILLVGPRFAAARPLEQSLRLRGFEVAHASSPNAAFDAFRGRSFGLVVAETRLGRDDGIELVPALRALPGVLDLPIVLLDERPSDARRAAARDAGACAYLAGSIVAQRLAASLARLATERRRRRFTRYARAVSVSWPDCAAPAVTAELGRGGCRLRGGDAAPDRTRFALHLPESGHTLRVRGDVVYRMKDGRDWSADGVGVRFAAFEGDAETEWIEFVSRIGAANGAPQIERAS